MAIQEHREMLDRLVRLMRAPQERAARVRAVIHSRWRRELRRKRCRILFIVTVTIGTLLIATLMLLWRGHWVR